jgi:DNA-directed RNA polymerase specialized sigma24 family protein
MWLEGFTGPEIAKASGLPYGVAAVRLTRIKMKLRKLMKNR